MMRRGERDSASRHFIFQLSTVPDHYTLLFSAATRVRPALNVHRSKQRSEAAVRVRMSVFLSGPHLQVSQFQTQN
jgi:hypothetical protein